jgi:hypothetical protein
MTLPAIPKTTPDRLARNLFALVMLGAIGFVFSVLLVHL